MRWGNSIGPGRKRDPSLIVGLASGVLVVGVLLAGCAQSGLFGTTGQGPVKTETRQAADFRQLDVSTGISVVLRIGPAQPMSVAAQENILPLVATEVVGGTLRIHPTHDYTSAEPVEVTVFTPSLDGIASSGGSHVQVDGLGSDSLDVKLTGGSVARATGSASSVALEVSGASRAEFGELAAKAVRVDLSGASNVTVRASEAVTGSASGAAKATVRGGGVLSVSTTGGASVQSE